MGGAIEFLQEVGVYDVILPFLLVFTLVFALLERTKLLGSEKLKVGGSEHEFTKKNLNSMVAFTIAFFVVASGQLVEVITKVSANMVVLLLAIVFALLSIGSFMKKGQVGDEVLKNEKWLRYGFFTVVLVVMTLIFLDGIKTERGHTWLEVIIDVVVNYWNTAAFASLVLIAIIIGFVYFVARPEKVTSEDKSS